MQSGKIITCLLAALLVSSPGAAPAFRGSSDDNQSGLNLETGYDTNTVTTMSGRIVSLLKGDDRRNAQLELDNDGSRAVVVLGPHRYWAENGITLKAGDEITVRGSKAQGTDGVVYILAQKISDTTQKTAVSLRNESGRPLWAGGERGKGPGQMNNRPPHMRQQAPGRMGGGRMGR